MSSRILIHLANHKNRNSLSNNFRKKRFVLFKNLVHSLGFPLKIIDVGGREIIWQQEGFCDPRMSENVKITLLNLESTKATHSNIKAVVGDARNMSQFVDGEFDIVFSNSVIEHVGNYEDQRQMANEIKRIGKRYFLQTPNRYFPIEPHFLFPFFQFLPLWFQIWLITHFHLGWRKKVSNKEEAIKCIYSVRLIDKKELIELFPNATIFEEKFLGLTKSFIVYNGWDIRGSFTDSSQLKLAGGNSVLQSSSSIFAGR